MPRRERSAGFVLFHGEPTDANRTYLLLDYGRHWDYPKGHVEPGEDELTAARRELFEETGIDQIELIDSFRHEIEYYFKSERHGLVRKSVDYFLARTRTTQVTLSDEHVDFDFLPFDLALRRLTYATAQNVLRAAHAFFEGSGWRSAAST
jgi:8-oxo-dGTP pyrophosphatase MutT (NUDIX family)